MAAQYPTSAGTDANLFVQVNNKSTTLSDNPLTSGATTVNVASTTGFPTAGYITIDAEAIAYTGVTATSFTTCTRGADGTTAASHTTGTNVFHNVVAQHHNGLKDEVKAIETDLVASFGALTPTAPTSTTTTLALRLGQIVKQITNITGLTHWYDAFTFLPIGNGGTNSGTVLSNGRIMVSQSGAIVENPNGGLTNGRIFTADPSGFPTTTGDGSLNGSLSFVTTSTQGISGTTTNDSAASGRVGEYISSTGANVSAPTSAQFGDITSISVPAGDWNLDLNVMLNTNAATLSGLIVVGIGTTTGNSSAGLVDGNSDAYIAPNATQTIASGVVPGYRVSIVSTTTYYAKMKATYSAGTPQFSGRISARRIR